MTALAAGTTGTGGSGPGVRVRVPATAANLGPGFDVLALALSCYNEFDVTLGVPALRIDITPPAPDLPRDATNIFVQAFAALCRAADRPVPPVAITMRLGIPPGRGLGSSATAVVGGLVAANTLLGVRLPAATLLPLAVAEEHGHHADNVAAALLGGLTVSFAEADTWQAVRLPVPDGLRAVLFVPDMPMDTVQGRALLPAAYPRADVVHSTGRVALAVAALTTGRLDLLRPAMQDRLHQPYRAQIFPALPRLIAAAERAGAYGACLSGGGSSVLALTAPRPGSTAVARALVAAAAVEGLTGRTLILTVDRHGAQAVALPALGGAP